MGTWGTAIYSNDLACDVRDDCKEIFAFYDVEEGNSILFKEYESIVEQSFIDNEYASFWYALADWQWKHGMLTQSIKDKTLGLLDSYAGIEDWEEDCSSKDIEKRKKVLDDLKSQLYQPMPPLKKPSKSVPKAKHKPGDIIIFKAKQETIDHEAGFYSKWKYDSFSAPYMFKSENILYSVYDNIAGYDARGNYMAILCIGTEKTLHSKFTENVFDECSIYTWYDYLSAEKPTVDTLKTCGFLPMVTVDLKDFNKHTISNINWTYSFTIPSEKFKNLSYRNVYEDIFKVSCPEEFDRYNYLFSKKNYSTYAIGAFDIYGMFHNAFQEKNRMELLGMSIDNLLDINVQNPKFLSNAEAEAAFRELMDKEMEQFYLQHPDIVPTNNI